MRLFCGKQRGTICVFLTLILVPVLLFSGIIVDASRLFASKTILSGAGDLTMNAALAQYDQDLKDKYGLMAMAVSPDSPKEKEALEQMFRESISARYLKTGKDDDIHSLVKMAVAENSFHTKGVPSSSLAQTDVLRQQIVEYMKFRGPVSIADGIIGKIKKLPFQNLKKQKNYLEKKADYGTKAAKLSDPLKKAKEAIEAQNSAIQSLKKADPSEALEQYRQQSVFWLAARALNKYMKQEIAAQFPSEDIDSEGVISKEKLKGYLNADVSVNSSETAFSDTTYRNMISLLAFYQSTVNNADAAAAVSKSNGFSASEVTAFRNIKKTINNNILTMDKIHKSAAKAYQESLKAFQKEAETIISEGDKAVTNLKKAKRQWKSVENAKQAYEKSKEELKDAGTDVSGLDSKGENVTIDEKEIDRQIDTIQSNISAAKEYKKAMETMKKIPDNLKFQEAGSAECEQIILAGGTAAINFFWSVHADGIWGGVKSVSAPAMLDPSDTSFYKNTLVKIKTEPADNKDQKEKKNEAKQSEEEYKNTKNNFSNAGGNERNLEEMEGYPNQYPSGIAKASLDTGTSETDGSIEVDNDEKAVGSIGGNLGWLDTLAGCVDRLAGNVMEQAYLMEYMSEMFNCMTTKTGDQSLSGDILSSHLIYQGEVEYILYGNSSTALNKAAAFGQLYALRLALDILYVFTDPTSNEVANGVAASVSGATGQAWLYPVIKYGYLLCSAIVSAASETVRLTKGEECPVWNGNKKITFCYKDYMKLFLLIGLLDENGKKTLVSRTGDCIQLNLQKTLNEKYTMLTLNVEVETSTTFLPKVPEFLGQGKSADDGKRRIRYRGQLAY